MDSCSFYAAVLHERCTHFSTHQLPPSCLSPKTSYTFAPTDCVGKGKTEETKSLQRVL